MTGNEVHDQHLRLRRFALALSTYALATLAVAVIGLLDLGALSPGQWLAWATLALLINLGFLVLLRSGANLRFRDPSLTIPQILAASVWGLIPLWALPAARPLVLMFFIPVFGFGMLRLNGRQYLGTGAAIMGEYGLLLGLEWLLHRPGFRPGYELFLFALFGLLVGWFALFGSLVSRLRRRLRKELVLIEEAHRALRRESEARQAAQAESERLVAELQQSLAEVRRLDGLLPICASCKKVRDDQGYWNQIEAYISSRTEAQFSHGVCPDCAKQLYPDLGDEGRRPKS